MSKLGLVVGLGNPGTKYQHTRHNAGFFVLDELAKRQGLQFKEQRQALTARWGNVHLLKPLTYMNLSGEAVQAVMTKERIPPQALLLIQDDIDLPLGRLRLKRGGGGSGGQRGIQDIIKRIGDDFYRLKLGVGRPPKGWTVPRWVLSSFQEGEQELLSKVIASATDAVENLVTQDAQKVMSQLNGLDLRKSSKPNYQLKPFHQNMEPYLEGICKLYSKLWQSNEAETKAYMHRYASHPGFRGFVALLDNEVVGLGFGHQSFPGHWWTEKVKHSLSIQQDLAQTWILVELAVLAEHRRKGLGTKLHNALLATQPCQQAMLTTQQNNEACNFYTKLGWQKQQYVVLSDASPAFALMAKDISRRLTT